MTITTKGKNKYRRLLKELLSSLIKEWGYDEVKNTLEELNIATTYGSDRQEGSIRTTRKASAVNFVQRETHRLEIPEERKTLLISVASQFDDKVFLPTVSDVRYFLEMHGQETHVILQRSKAFPNIFNVLLPMPYESLNTIIQGVAYSGPSELGPLSDAIKAAGAILRPNGDDKSNASVEGTNLERDAKNDISDRDVTSSEK